MMKVSVSRTSRRYFYTEEFSSQCKSTAMKKTTKTNRYAIWIDHKQAVIMCLDGEGRLTSETLRSGLAERVRYDGEVTNKTGLFRHTLGNEQHRQNKTNNDYRKFLREVAAHLDKVNGILILGPGDGRHELQHEIQKKKSLASVWLENRPADKMRASELKDVVLEHFSGQ
jgi:hypothetical protein